MLYAVVACTEGQLSILKINIMKWIAVYNFMLNHLIAIVTIACNKQLKKKAIPCQAVFNQGRLILRGQLPLFSPFV